MDVYGNSTTNEFNPKGMEVRLTSVPDSWDDATLKIKLQDPLTKFNEEHCPEQEFDYDVLAILDKSSEDLRWDSWDGVREPNTARLVVPYFELGKQLVLVQSLQLADGIKLGVTEIKLQDTDDAKYEELRKSPYKIPWNPTILKNGDVGQILSIDCGSFNDEGGFDITYDWTPPPAGFDTLCWFGDLWPKKFHACISASGPAEKPEERTLEWLSIALPNIHGLIIVPGSNGMQELFFIVDKPPRFYRRSPKPPRQSFAGLSEHNLPADLIARDGSITASITPERGYRVPFPCMGPAAPESPEVIGVPFSIQYSRVYRFKIQGVQPGFTWESLMKEVPERVKDKVFVFNHSAIPSGDSRQTFTRDIKEAARMIDTYNPECRLALYKMLYNCNIPPSSMKSVDEELDLFQKDFKSKPTCRDVAFLHALLKTSAEKMGNSQVRALKRLYKGTPPNMKDETPRDTVVADPTQAIKECSRDKTLKNRYSKSGATIPKQVFHLLIFPSHAEIHGPENAPANSVTQEYGTEIHRFLSVRFVENTGDRLRAEPGINADAVIEQRVYGILKAPLGLSGKQYEFLGYSNSSLKNSNQVWLFSREDSSDKVKRAEEIRSWIGDWERSKDTLGRNPPKWGARIGQAFSATTTAAELAPEEWEVWEDINSVPRSGPPLPYTDGCGFISSSLCDKINDFFKLEGAKRSTAFQIRFGGAKGVVYRAPDVLFRLREKPSLKMVLRKSLVKFHVPAERYNQEIPLRIVSVAEAYRPAAFNKPLLKALEDIGATKETILDVYKRNFEELAKVSSDSLNLLRSTENSPTGQPEAVSSGRRVLGYDALLKLCFVLADRSIPPEKYGDAFLKLFLAKVLENRRTEDLFKVPIPGSYTALGLTDDCQILGTDDGQIKGLDEVYVRTTGENITGRVLVYRNPIIHIGDIQWAKAISDKDVAERINDLKLSTEITSYIKKLEESEQKKAKDNIYASITSMDNVIFFSQKGERPLPNKLSGGDLDGDKYHILTPDCGFLNDATETKGAATYDPETEKPERPGSDWDVAALSRFVGSFVRNDCLGLLSRTLLVISDWLPEGLDAPECQRLAAHISRAVDFQKNGVPVDFPRLVREHPEFRTASRPDFYRAVDAGAYYDKRGDFYTSKRLLGAIYRAGKGAKLPVGPGGADDSALAGLAEADARGLFEPGRASQGMKAMLRGLVGDGLTDYRVRLKSQSARYGRSEVAVLLPSWERRSRFEVGDVLESIEDSVASVLEEHKVIERTSPPDGPTKWKIIGSGVTEDILQSMYKELLFESWKCSLDLSKEPNPSDGYPAGNGVSYAYLCLYLCYTRTFSL